MTETMEWLVATQGLGGLGENELNALRDFTLLWGLFESKAMATRGSQPELIAAVERMSLPALIPIVFHQALDFWRHRYWQASQPTDAFRALNFGPNPFRELAITVLSGANNSPGDVTKTLLLVVMRLRNNLFHGVKWQYQLQGQLGNLTHANAVLMMAICLTPPAL